MTSPLQPAFETTASYYDLSSKKWKTGIFLLTDKLIQFNSDEQLNISLSLHTLSGLEKRQSSLIYAAIVISVAADKHWFASFPNRDSVFNLIELFWREALLSRNHKTVSPRSTTGSTNLGKDLINLLHESENTLVNAANSLSDQGHQIEETQATVENINSDLNVAEKFIKSMSFTSSILQLASSSKVQEEPRKCFRVSFSFTELLNDSSLWKIGTLFFGEKISIVDENKVNQLSLDCNEVSSWEVMSPYRITLRFTINENERVCYIMYPKLLKLLHFLSSIPSMKDKIFYCQDISFPSTTTSTSLSYSAARPQSESFIPKSDSFTSNSGMPNSEQMQEIDSVISEEDIQEITSMLNNLQDLASEINREQQSQLDKIDSLMTNVEKTELRIKADSKDIKKLI